jgi:hypothetical protein
MNGRSQFSAVRYADDCNIYVRGQWAGERVMAGIEQFRHRAVPRQTSQLRVTKPRARRQTERPQVPGLQLHGGGEHDVGGTAR